MVTLKQAQASNALIPKALPDGLVAVFVGGTSGIGEYTLRALAKYAVKPKVYVVGRSQEAADRILADCQKANPEGQFIFIKADVGPVKNVDEVCREIKSKESAINLLFLTQGSLALSKTTSDGLSLPLALGFHSRIRFIANLLPLVQQATSLRRVVTVLAATKEGPVDLSDPEGKNISFAKMRGHGAGLLTLGLEALARDAPTVSFVHTFPGLVKTGIGRDMSGVLGAVLTVFSLFGPLVGVPIDTSGELNLYAATSAQFPAREGGADGVPLLAGLGTSKGSNAKEGSGVYNIDEKNEAANAKVNELLAQMRKDGKVEKVWDYAESEFKRILGSGSV